MRRLERLTIGAGGAGLIAALFLPWARVGGAELDGWELSNATDTLCLVVGLIALGAAVTGGRFGFFRPDVSLNGTADMLGVVAALVIARALFLDFPAGAERESGGIVALISATAIFGGAGDYSPLRGAPLFPRLP